MALQHPLNELYMRYLTKDDNDMRKKSLHPNSNNGAFMTLPGTVEISKTGLKVIIMFVLYKKLIQTRYNI